MGNVFGSKDTMSAYSKDVAKAALSKNKTAKHHRDSILEAFQEWDTNNDGFIDKTELLELMKTLNNQLTETQVDSLMKAADTNLDDKMDYKEMVDWIFRAPHLEHYFKAFDELEAKISGEVRKFFKNNKNTQQEWTKLQTRWQDKCNKMLTPLVKKTFLWHDKLDQGWLVESESIEFFCNYVEGMLKHKESVLYINTFFSITDVPEGADVNMNKVKELIAGLGPGMLEAFKAEYVECCTAAFAILDANKDQQLVLEEVTDGLLPGRERHNDLLKALKVFVNPEAAAAAAGEAAGAEDDPAAAAAVIAGDAAAAPADAAPAAAGAEEAAVAPAEDAAAAPAEDAAAAPAEEAAAAPAEDAAAAPAEEAAAAPAEDAAEAPAEEAAEAPAEEAAEAPAEEAAEAPAEEAAEAPAEEVVEAPADEAAEAPAEEAAEAPAEEAAEAPAEEAAEAPAEEVAEAPAEVAAEAPAE